MRENIVNAQHLHADAVFNEASELPPHRLALLRRFFQDYKILEQKADEADEFQPAAVALPITVDVLERYRSA